jgi:hypothetical protein
MTTNFVFMPSQSGTVFVYTTQGWLPILNVPNAFQVWSEIKRGQGATVNVGPPADHPLSAPGAGRPNSSGPGFHTPDCRNQRGAPCPGVYDTTPYGDRGTGYDLDPSRRPGNRPR